MKYVLTAKNLSEHYKKDRRAYQEQVVRGENGGFENDGASIEHIKTLFKSNKCLDTVLLQAAQLHDAHESEDENTQKTFTSRKNFLA